MFSNVRFIHSRSQTFQNEHLKTLLKSASRPSRLRSAPAQTRRMCVQTPDPGLTWSLESGVVRDGERPTSSVFFLGTATTSASTRVRADFARSRSAYAFTLPTTLFRGKIFQCAHPGEIFIDIYQYHMHSITNTRTSVQCTSCCVQTGRTMAKSPPKGPSTPVRASPRPRDRTATGRAGGGWNERKCARPNDSDHKEYFHAPES